MKNTISSNTSILTNTYLTIIESQTEDSSTLDNLPVLPEEKTLSLPRMQLSLSSNNLSLSNQAQLSNTYSVSFTQSDSTYTNNPELSTSLTSPNATHRREVSITLEEIDRDIEINNGKNLLDYIVHDFEDTANDFQQLAKKSEPGRPSYDLNLHMYFKSNILAFVTGSEKAPYNLALCYLNGRGTEQNDYFAQIMFGIANKLNDERYKEEEYPITHSPKLLGSITRLFAFSMQANKKFGEGFITIDNIVDQRNSFEDISKTIIEEQSISVKNQVTTKNYSFLSSLSMGTKLDDVVNQQNDPDEQVELAGQLADTSGCSTSTCCVFL